MKEIVNLAKPWLVTRINNFLNQKIGFSHMEDSFDQLKKKNYTNFNRDMLTSIISGHE